MLFKEFFGLSQIWTTSDTNNRIKRVEKWYSCYWVQCEALHGEWKEISNILFRKHDHKHVAVWLLNYKKSKRSLKIMRFVKISWYHTWRLWWKKEIISNNLSCTMFTSQSILEEESYRWEGFGKIWCESDDRIRVWLQNFLYMQ